MAKNKPIVDESQRNDLLLKDSDGDSLLIDGRNIAYFFAASKGDCTKVFMRQSSWNKVFDVTDSIDELRSKIDEPCVVLHCHKSESSTRVLGIKVDEIAACVRDSGKQLTSLFMKKKSGNDDYFNVIETPEEIAARIEEACREKASSMNFR